MVRGALLAASQVDRVERVDPVAEIDDGSTERRILYEVRDELVDPNSDFARDFAVLLGTAGGLYHARNVAGGGPVSGAVKIDAPETAEAVDEGPSDPELPPVAPRPTSAPLPASERRSAPSPDRLPGFVSSSPDAREVATLATTLASEWPEGRVRPEDVAAVLTGTFRVSTRQHSAPGPVPRAPITIADDE
jgi:pyruvate/2-oxoglutarate dehydrogenase complex dihydrolipoamide acyltransferase (E2) component